MHISSYNNDFIITVIFHSSSALGSFDLRISKIAYYNYFLEDKISYKECLVKN